MVSTPLFVSGVITRKRYNHKNLIKALNNYHNQNNYNNIVPYIDFKMQLPEEFLNVTDRVKIKIRNDYH